MSRRWLLFTPALPAAGLLLLLRAGSGNEVLTRTHLPSSARAGRAFAPTAFGRVEPAATAQRVEEKHAAPRAAVSAPAPSSPLRAQLGPLLIRLQSATEADDERSMAARRADISHLVANDPKAALDALLSMFKATSDESELGVLLSVLTTEPELPRDAVLDALGAIAQRDELPLHRQAAIHGLGEVPGGDEARVALVASLGRKDAAPEVRDTAAVTVGALGDRAPGAVAQSAARETVASLAAESDPRVRASLVYAIRDTREAPVADALLGALADQEATVRLAAADMLGDVAAAHRERAVAQLAARFAQENETEVRRTIVTAIVRAGRIAAIPVLEKLAGGEQQALIDDFLVGLRSGEDNIEKLYAIRFAREKARNPE